MKVLILAYDFPPYVSVGGLRPYNWYKYFKESGVEPIVITRQWSNKHGSGLDYVTPSEFDYEVRENTEYGTIIRTPYKPNLSNRLLLKYGPKKLAVLRKSITAFFEIFQFFLPIGPKYGLYKAAKQYLVDNKIDVIIATGDPFVLFHYASCLSKQFDIPWVADYRDPWSASHLTDRKPIQKWFNRGIEKRTVKTAKLVITVGELFKQKIQELFPHKEVQIIKNGFNPDVFNDIPICKASNDILRIAHAGTLYSWQPLESFILGWSEAISKNPKMQIEVDFIGVNDKARIKNFVENNCPDLMSSIKFTRRIPNAKLPNYLSQKHLLLLFTCYEFTGTKIYDYLAMNRRILYCFSKDIDGEKLRSQLYFKDSMGLINLRPQESIITASKAGIICKDRHVLTDVLSEAWKELQEHGDLQSNTINSDIYSRRNQTREFSELISRFVTNSPQ